jgi:DHA3 family macrolide efflux protein-like MFS transporter
MKKEEILDMNPAVSPSAADKMPPVADEGVLSMSRSFLIVWLGQLISVIGTSMTGFALIVWVYQQTGQVTQVALLSFFLIAPGILISPLAGVVVDRRDRRLVMLACDLAGAACSLVIAVLLLAGQLAVWHVYVATAVLACAAAFQWPAYSAAVTLLVPKRHLARASGMVQTAQGLAQLLAPLLAGFFIASLGIQAVILCDLATFLVAVGTLMAVRFPAPPESAAGREARGSIWKEAVYGLRYIYARPGLLGLLLMIAASNLFQGYVMVLAAPFLLARTSPAMVGLLSSIAGSGMLAGALAMSAWGGPRRRVYGVLGALTLSGICMVVVGLWSRPVVFAVLGFGFLASIPVLSSCSQAIWQAKVEPDVQGKVFAIRLMIASSFTPLAYLSAGPLVDRVLTPLLTSGSAFATAFNRWAGGGAQGGISLLFVIVGLLSMGVAAAGLLVRRIRLLEDQIPDAPADVGPLPA